MSQFKRKLKEQLTEHVNLKQRIKDQERMTQLVKRETEIKKADGNKRYSTEANQPKTKDKTMRNEGIIAKSNESSNNPFDKILASETTEQYHDSRYTHGKNAIQHMSEQTIDSKMKLSEITKDQQPRHSVKRKHSSYNKMQVS